MIGHAMAALGVNHTDWRAVTPATADFRGLEPAPRLFLFALVAIGYLLLRTGRLDAGREALGKVCQFAPDDRFGAARLIAVADQHELEEAGA